MKSATAVILAAGASSRLGELARHYSKPTVPIAGQPLIGRVIGSLRAAGIARVVVVGHPSDHRLVTFLREHHPEIAVVMQSERRGIADALRHALPLLAREAGYLVCACDSLFVPDDIARVQRFGQAQPGDAVIGVLATGTEAATRGAVRLGADGPDSASVLEIVHKPASRSELSGVLATPLYWLPRSFAPYVDTVVPGRGESDISSALNSFIIGGGAVHAVRVTQCLPITVQEDLERAAAWFRHQEAQS